jgi:phage gp36-like protein
MKALLAATEDFIKRERGQIAADANAGSNVTITVQSAEGVSSADHIVMGYEGSETAELCTVTGVTSTTITVSALKFTHKADEPFVVYRFNQRKFYGASSAAGPYTELTADGSPKDISVDDPQGTLLEYSGTAYTYFKSTYYNNTTTDETDIADAIAVSGDESARYATLYAIRCRAGLTQNPFISDSRIEAKRVQAENEINSALFSRYLLPLNEVPALVSYICELLAAGYIDYEEFGADGQGVKWLGEARAILKQITDGSRRLLDSSYKELARNAKTGVLDGYPNAADTDPAQFGMTDRY